jgi:thioredoxin reductase (NADPH)
MAVRRRRDIWDVVIVGGGIAGLTAAMQASARGLAAALVEPSLPGGLVATVNALDDWPSEGPVSGAALAARLAEQARLADVAMLADAAQTVSAEGTLLDVHLADRRLRARSVICASGARLAPLGVEDEARFHGIGWSQCAWCDGHFFKGQDVVVVGGGDSALQQALVLAPLARSVSVIVRSRLRARHARIERASGQPNVRFVWNSVVRRLQGGDGLEAVELEHVQTGVRSSLACTGVFPFIGLLANDGYVPVDVRRDVRGGLCTDGAGRTSMPGVYAIGALRAGGSGDLVSASGDAANAVADIARELER